MSLSLDSVAFADGRYRFALTLKLIVEIERNCGHMDRDGVLQPKSIYRIHDELSGGLALDDDTPVYLGGGDARASDIREVIRCGLIGGNSGVVAGVSIEVGPAKAGELCDSYLFPHRPLIEGQYLAWAILDACIRGVTLKKKAESDEQETEESRLSTEA